MTDLRLLCNHFGCNNKVLVFKLIEHQKEALVERDKDNKTDDEDDIYKNEDDGNAICINWIASN